MSERYFGPEEVERLIPALTQVMARIRQASAEAAGIRDRRRAEKERIAMAGGGVVDRAAWRADTDRLTALARQMEQGLGEIVALGGAPKDLGQGLVDFPHLRDGREVNLCWKYGERSIRYWHGLDEGYAGRKPL